MVVDDGEWMGDGQEAKKDGQKYNKNFFTEFGSFLKEGICHEGSSKEDIATLLRMESSATPEYCQSIAQHTAH